MTVDWKVKNYRYVDILLYKIVIVLNFVCAACSILSFVDIILWTPSQITTTVETQPNFDQSQTSLLVCQYDFKKVNERESITLSPFRSKNRRELIHHSIILSWFLQIQASTVAFIIKKRCMNEDRMQSNTSTETIRNHKSHRIYKKRIRSMYHGCVWCW